MGLLRTLINGQPNFEVLKPYMPKNLNLKQLGKFMNATFEGRLNEEKVKRLRGMEREIGYQRSGVCGRC